MKLTLEISPTPEVRARREFTASTLTIGRGRECDLMLARPMVSSVHARLDCKNGVWILTDLLSTNGTFVNGNRISGGVKVAPGDVIQFGEAGPHVHFLFFNQAAESSPPPIVDPPIIAPPVILEAPSPFATSIPSKIPAPTPPVSPARPHPEIGAVRPKQAARPSSKPRGATSIRNRKSTTGSLPAAWFHGAAATLTLFTSFAGLLIYGVFTLFFPARGYTSLGLLFGLIGTFLLMSVGIYSWRKRWGQELLPGRLQAWLRVHLWLSLIGLSLVVLHAGFHLDGGSGSWTMIMLTLTVVTGIIGWIIYVQTPGKVYSTVGNLATGDVENQLRGLKAEIEDACAGGSKALALFAEAVLRGRRPTNYSPAPDDAAAAQLIAQLGEKRRSLTMRLNRQRRLHFLLRFWLLIHIPCALLFGFLLPWHVFDATEMTWVGRRAGPKDFASSESCAKCHPNQYNEWITSMHAIAQSSPVTDLQNRLVLYKEARDLKSGNLQQPLVGDLCVKCHAPTGSLGPLSKREDPLIEIKDRAPASQFGVSCVACHQIDQIHQLPRPDSGGLEYKNTENLEWTFGRTMLGSFGKSGESAASVGNSEHRGEFRDFFGDSKFCASCHTVAVDDSAGNRIVKLQDTYTEWKEGGDKKSTGLNWFAEKVDCMDCHGRDLTGLSETARRLARDRIPLEDRRTIMLDGIKGAQQQGISGDAALAAFPERGYDLRLKPRRRFLHTFTGVDYHLEPSLPYSQGHPRESENARIQEQTLKQTQDLLAIAAALQVKRKNESSVELEILNLATGHHLPAGFAFARETWLEIAVSQFAAGEADSDWRVLVGGRHGRPLANSESLDKREIGLRNFQAALYNQQHLREVVLQNETDGVLAGDAFINQNLQSLFPDREGFLVPGEIRFLRIDLSGRELELQSAKRIRARLLIRNLPPEFLNGLADKFEKEENDLPRATRARNLINGLRIHEITRDILLL